MSFTARSLSPYVPALVAGIAASACGASEAVGPRESRVWSQANSQDGYAACPAGTTVTGGGFEMQEKSLSSGHVPLVTASRPEANGWRVVCADASGRASSECRAWVTCASVLAR
jgi:hypothetical protein